jgi:hypothetical protein
LDLFRTKAPLLHNTLATPSGIRLNYSVIAARGLNLKLTVVVGRAHTASKAC